MNIIKIRRKDIFLMILFSKNLIFCYNFVLFEKIVGGNRSQNIIVCNYNFFFFCMATKISDLLTFIRLDKNQTKRNRNFWKPLWRKKICSVQGIRKNAIFPEIRV